MTFEWTHTIRRSENRSSKTLGFFQNYMENLLKWRSLATAPRVSDSTGLWRHSRIQTYFSRVRVLALCTQLCLILTPGYELKDYSWNSSGCCVLNPSLLFPSKYFIPCTIFLISSELSYFWPYFTVLYRAWLYCTEEPHIEWCWDSNQVYGHSCMFVLSIWPWIN